MVVELEPKPRFGKDEAHRAPIIFFAQNFIDSSLFLAAPNLLFNVIAIPAIKAFSFPDRQNQFFLSLSDTEIISRIFAASGETILFAK